MAIEELVAVKPPPLQPIDAGPLLNRESVEESLGLVLPNDLIEFCGCYGSGRFGDTIRVYNLFSASYVEMIHQACSVYDDLRNSEGDDFVPYEVHPKSPGLFPWGDDVNGHMMFWLTAGNPAHWPIVLLTVDGESEQLDLPMTTFLARILNRDTSCLLWDDAWLQENVAGLSFVPEGDDGVERHVG